MGTEFSEARAFMISEEIIICREELSKVSFAASQSKKPTRVNKIADSVKNCPLGVLSLKTRNRAEECSAHSSKQQVPGPPTEIGSAPWPLEPGWRHSRRSTATLRALRASRIPRRVLNDID